LQAIFADRQNDAVVEPIYPDRTPVTLALGGNMRDAFTRRSQ
jgi:hypothetical protein